MVISITWNTETHKASILRFATFQNALDTLNLSGEIYNFNHIVSRYDNVDDKYTTSTLIIADDGKQFSTLINMLMTMDIEVYDSHQEWFDSCIEAYKLTEHIELPKEFKQAMKYTYKYPPESDSIPLKYLFKVNDYQISSRYILIVDTLVGHIQSAFNSDFENSVCETPATKRAIDLVLHDYQTIMYYNSTKDNYVDSIIHDIIDSSYRAFGRDTKINRLYESGKLNEILNTYNDKPFNWHIMFIGKGGVSLQSIVLGRLSSSYNNLSIGSYYNYDIAQYITNPKCDNLCIPITINDNIMCHAMAFIIDPDSEYIKQYLKMILMSDDKIIDNMPLSEYLHTINIEDAHDHTIYNYICKLYDVSNDQDEDDYDIYSNVEYKQLCEYHDELLNHEDSRTAKTMSPLTKKDIEILRSKDLYSLNDGIDDTDE